MQAAKGVAAGLVALIACPCHLVFTLPLLLALTGGTAFSAWLLANQRFLWLALTVIFIGSLLLAFYWLMQIQPADDCEECKVPAKEASNV